jgi:hypothetical protein
MKKYLVLLSLLVLAFVGFGQDLTPVEATPWYASTEFLVVLGGAVLVVIEWVLRFIPTSKPIGFVLRAVVAIIQWLINRVPDKRKIKK